MPESDDKVTVRCRACGTMNRLPVEKALADMSKPTCGSCGNRMFLVGGEPLVELEASELAHPWDRQALDKLRAVPYADKLLETMFKATLDKLARFRLLANAVRIDEKQAPRLWALYLEAAGRINTDPVPLFIIQNPMMNAFAIGAGSPMIAVTSGLLDGMEDREILGVLGPELTQVRLGHVLYRTLAILIAQGGLMLLDRLLGIGRVLVMPLQVALTKWYQMSELSADRGELVASGNLTTFVRTHMLLAGGTNRFMPDLDTEAFIEQARDAEKFRDEDILVWAAELFAGAARTHPLPAWRVHHGMKWARSEDYFNILAGLPRPLLEKPTAE